MSVVGDFTIPAESFALPDALPANPQVSAEADRLASHSTMGVMPFLWVTGADTEQFQSSLDADRTTKSATIAEETDEKTLYQVEWRNSFCTLIDEMVDHHAAITEATATGDRWKLRLRFSEEQMVSEFQSHFRGTGREFAVERLHATAESGHQVYGLTDEQREALLAAVDSGYFSIPRSSSAEEVGDDLDISANAASERIRRGTETLIRSGLRIAEDD